MSKCHKCNVEILDETEVCPLCRSVLEQTEELENMYPNARLKTQKLLWISRLYLFCIVLVEFILIMLDFTKGGEINWSIVVGLLLLYSYMVLRYAVIGETGYQSKTIVLTLITVFVAIGVDFATGYRGWAVDYVISSSILLVDIGIIVLMIYNRRNWQSYLMSQIFMILCSIIPVILYLLGLEKNGQMAFLPLVVSAFLFLGTIMIGGRRACLELKRRFHI